MLFAGLITRLVRDEQKEGPIAELCSSYPMVVCTSLPYLLVLHFFPLFLQTTALAITVGLYL